MMMILNLLLIEKIAKILGIKVGEDTKILDELIREDGF